MFKESDAAGLFTVVMEDHDLVPLESRLGKGRVLNICLLALFINFALNARQAFSLHCDLQVEYQLCVEIVIIWLT